MKERNAIIRLHGGCGNQIFQIFYVLNEFKYKNIRVYFDNNYPHRFTLAKEFQDCHEASGLQKLFIKSRMVKLIEKAKMLRSCVKFWNYYYDGYFQDVRLYKNYDTSTLLDSMNYLKLKFQIQDSCNNKDLIHLRLGDFFKSEYERVIAAKKILEQAKVDSDLITTDDQLIYRNNDLKKIISKKKICHISTDEMTSGDLIRLISQYRSTVSNGSTLAFWGSCFGGKEIELNNSNLNSMAILLKSLNIKSNI
jgi:hypothetical protein